MVERFTSDEIERLNKLLTVEINPYLYGEGDPVCLPLGGKTEKWLFETRVNLPADVQAELERIGFDELPKAFRVQLLNDILENRQTSSAPKWWEMNFFEAGFDDLWDFFAEQCRQYYDDTKYRQEVFDSYVSSLKELEQAQHVLRVSKVNKNFFSEEQQKQALDIYDSSYPIDFIDYEEAPRKIRSPLDGIRSFIAPELSDLNSIFTKRWFEFKILDELAGFTSFRHDGARDSDLSKRIARQVRGYMYGQVLSLGRMVEHYRWKFSYEEDALRGIQSTVTSKVRGEKGGAASRKRRLANLEILIQEIEKLSQSVGTFSEERIVEQAFEAARDREAKMPSSKRTLDEYGTALRSEEPFKSRYEAVFRKNA
ncbi:hypothetical protein C1J05_10815 [Sulfitobacter sp. JL08]|uniref:hypothetical protein n=1 Tax=Sulfitobacter sp. JL08 TaxID=2070369 RepID=UPI000E0B93A8|nr:hypothetical protein [Sulfitobacter sp. JL08]AXI54921.1 hypothetical protein C1J05_10815 [Sulfitobacter sp. JL08]